MICIQRKTPVYKTFNHIYSNILDFAEREIVILQIWKIG